MGFSRDRRERRSHQPASLARRALGKITSRRASAFSEAKASRKVSTPSTQRIAEACPDLGDRMASLTPPPGAPVLNQKRRGFCSKPKPPPLL